MPAKCFRVQSTDLTSQTLHMSLPGSAADSHLLVHLEEVQSVVGPINWLVHAQKGIQAYTCDIELLAALCSNCCYTELRLTRMLYGRFCAQLIRSRRLV